MPFESSATLFPLRAASASNRYPVAESPASIPTYSGWIEPLTTPHSPGMRPAFFAIAIVQVAVPTTFTTSPSAIPAPIASQCASNAPTGIGIPARSPIFAAHSALRCPAILSDV